MLRLTLLFIVLIIYGSLFPFAVWVMPRATLFGFLLVWPAHLSRPDVVQNVLAYAPFGLFLACWLLARGRRTLAGLSLRVGGAAMLLSLTMESLQQFEPARNASTADIVMNVLGALAGALLALLLRGGHHRAQAGRPPRWRWLGVLHDTHARHVRTGVLPTLGLTALALWALAETSPLVPVFDATYLGRKIAILMWQLAHPAALGLPRLVVAFAQISSLGLMLCLLMRDGPRGPRVAVVPWFAALLGAVFVFKLLVYGRAVLIEEVLGAVLALITVHASRKAGATTLAGAGAALLISAFIADELMPGPGLITWRFNWVPLAGQMRSLAGLENILALFWPFFTLAIFVRSVTPLRQREAVSWMGAGLVLALVFELEWMQQSLPGRYGDITQVLLALGAWLLPWSFRTADFSDAPIPVRPANTATPAPSVAIGADSNTV